MYKVLLVEDEAMVRKAIIKIIDWKGLGYELIAEAGNGEEAVEILEQEKVDLVLTDICMPFMDGLELARYIKTHYSHIKVAVITGHDEFQYAKQAVEFNVSKYILKPVTAEELTEDLKEIKGELDKDHVSQAYIMDLKKDFVLSRNLLKTRFLNFVIEERLSETEIANQIEDLNITLDEKEHGVILFKVRNSEEAIRLFGEENSQLLHFAILNVVNEIIDTEGIKGICFHHRKHCFAMIAGKNSYITREKFYHQLELLLTRVSQKLKQFIGVELSIGIGNVYEELKDMHYSYLEAHRAVEYSHFAYEGMIVHIKDIEERSRHIQEDIDELSLTLSKGIRFVNEDQVAESIHRLQALMKRHAPSAEQMRIYMMGVSLYLMRVGDELFEDKEETLNLSKAFYYGLYEINTLDESIESLRNICKEMIDKIKLMQQNSIQLTVTKACHHISQNYEDSEYCLEDLAGDLFLSTNYLSKLIKRERGETFKSYLTGLRMDKAKNLLTTTHLKTYEIATRVGYKDPHYFSYLFKKHSGMTTKAYRQKEA